MAKFDPGNRVKTTYRMFDIEVMQENGFFYYSVLTPEEEEIISGFIEEDTGISTFTNYLRKQVDEYILNPEAYAGEYMEVGEIEED